jgi:glutamate dehydrogenase/leucine dehydrogenase
MVGMSSYPGDPEEVFTVWHRHSGLNAAVAINSTVRGPALGGARFRAYPDLDSAVTEACNLAEAMTLKTAVAGIPFGGGKAVLIGDPAITKTTELLIDYASLLNTLRGRYITAEDVGATRDDMDLLKQHTTFVAGTSVELGGSGDPSPLTAVGVLSAMRAAAARSFGSDDLEGRHVAVSGLGKVGSALVELLLERHCQVTAADVSAKAIERVAGLGAVEMVAPSYIHRTPCDIFAPCALGGVLNELTVGELQCTIVCGAANNQLSAPEIGDLLQVSGILYVPDFVANAGGVINIANEPMGYDPDRARSQVEEIYTTTSTILDRAVEHRTTPLAAAMSLAKERLAV